MELEAQAYQLQAKQFPESSHRGLVKKFSMI